MEIYILAGGKSTRMGRDKAVLTHNQKTFLEILCHLCKAHSDTVTIVSPHPAHTFPNSHTLADILPDKGPLGGIFTALTHTNAEKILTLSVDMPFISEKILQTVIKAGDTQDFIAAKNKENIYPLLGVYPKRLIPEIQATLSENKLKMKDFLAKNNASYCIFNEDASLFANINTPDDYLKQIPSRVVHKELKIFGKLSEILPSRLDITFPTTLKALKNNLYTSFPELKNHTFTIAVRQKITQQDRDIIIPEDEIALMPPFSGG